ncbi:MULTISPECIES: transcription elongation factor GreA [Ruminococcus]|jgi:transcription elongation factor GreA|uniref:Transcription elongation factor GreA n=1 Tax=Ruminococcus albus 8 TaxID=246199 RepID=E9S9L0_RUMAL|nr:MULTISPECIES: transcription elongation factor GreA [Ruminococcus]EGC04038.1 transcription elongation factor GreA [Ruminococcus albus 8]MBR0529692.1 transcription elongation factor GreA [Ruminococcus sp.]MCC3351137.1 transcription elongation factor GreA [Ruminococcus albus 8]
MEINKTVSKAGYAKLVEEKEYLVTVKRKEVAQKLKEARSFGDLSENAEYDEAKNEQAILESRINELEILISNATVVDDDEVSVHEIGVGSYVKLKDLELDEVETLQIVGSTESDPDNGKISDESPIGKAAMHMKVGDIFEVEAPAGMIKFEVLEITRE